METSAAAGPAGTDPAVPPPWPMVLRSCLEPVVQVRWQIATVCALGVAALSWLPVWSGAKAPMESDLSTAIAMEAAAEEPAPKEDAKAAPATALPNSAAIPGLAQARALTGDQLALRSPIPTPPGPSREAPKTLAPVVPAPEIRSEPAPSTTAARPHATPKVHSQPKDAPAKSIARRSKSKSKKKKKQDDSMLAKVSRSVQDFFGGDKRR